MINVKHLMSLTVLAAMLAFNLPLAHAISFNPFVSISGETNFDESFSFGTSGSFNKIVGGTDTTSTYTGNTVTGDNPLTATFTDLNDGLGFTGTASATNDIFGIGFDATINVTNNSLNVIGVIFNLVYSNSVNAQGSDAVSDSELLLFDDSGEIFFSDLVSDTFNGNENNGVSTGVFGGALAHSGDLLFTYTLNPSEQVNLDLIWTLEEFSGDYAGGIAEADLTAFLSIDTVVPLPGALLLMISGMLLFPLQHLIRKS